MSKRTYALMTALTVLLLAVLATTIVVAQGPPEGDGVGPVGTVDVDEIQEDAIRALLDENGEVVNPDQQLARVSEEHPGGFGGWYFSEDKDTVYVFMTDTSKTGAAEAAFNSAYMGQHSPTNVVAVSGTHSMDELSTWLTQIIRALASAEIAFRGAAIYHDQNKIKIGLAESASLEDAKNARDGLGIPASAIEFSIGSRGGFLSGDDLEDKWRPLVGGIQHQQVRDGLKCTIGFGTERDDEEGIILASHCTNESRRLWGNDSAVIHQPVNPFGPFTNTVADETIDPLGQASGNILCTDFGYLCRYSDAAYAELDSDEDLDLGHIAEPEDYNTIEVNPADDTLEIDSDSGSFSVGDEIEFIGRTSGWEKGIVTNTCYSIIVENPQLGNPGKVVLCAGEFEAAPGYDGPDRGDSGGPVFIRDGNNVELIGTIFFEESGMFYFSRIGYIYYDLDTYASWDSCVSGC